MNRRQFLATAGTVTLAGCTEGSASGDSNNSTDDTSDDDMKNFKQDLADAGIDVDSTMGLGGGLSVMYYRRSEKAEQDRHRLALAYANNPGVSGSLVTATSLMPSGDSRYANISIEREWVDAYNAGELSKSEFLGKVDDTIHKY